MRRLSQAFMLFLRDREEIGRGEAERYFDLGWSQTKTTAI